MRKLALMCLLFLCLITVGCSTSKQSSASGGVSASAPSGVSIFPNINRIQLSWAANSLVSYFNIYRSVAGQNDYVKIGTSTSNGYSDAVFLYNTTYQYVITAVYAGNIESERTNPVYGSILNQVAPDPPTALNVLETQTSITIRWTASDDEDLDYFDVYRSLSRSTNFEQINEVPIHKTFSSYLDTNVVEDITYYYRIKATDVAGNESHFSDFVSGNRIDRVPPTKPTFLDFEIDELNVSVTVNWDQNTEEDLEEYRIYRSTLEETIPRLIATVPAGTEFYLDTDVSQNTIYDYYLTAYDDDGNESEFSTRRRITIDDIVAPSTPGNITSTFNSTRILIDWDDNTEFDISGYQIYRSTSESGTYTRQNINTLTSSSYSDTNVERTKTYYYKLVAQDADANKSNESAVITVEYFPEIDTYSIQSGLSIVLNTFEGSEKVATFSYTTSYLDHFSTESGITKTTLVHTQDGSSETTRIYTKKVSGVTYMYVDTAPFIGASGNSETLSMTAFIQDDAKVGYTSDFIRIVGFETVTGPDDSDYYVAKVLDLNYEENTRYYYIGENFLFLGDTVGDNEASPDSTTYLTSFDD